MVPGGYRCGLFPDGDHTIRGGRGSQNYGYPFGGPYKDYSKLGAYTVVSLFWETTKNCFQQRNMEDPTMPMITELKPSAKSLQVGFPRGLRFRV